jgi:hypothetical protein
VTTRTITTSLGNLTRRRRTFLDCSLCRIWRYYGGRCAQQQEVTPLELVVWALLPNRGSQCGEFCIQEQDMLSGGNRWRSRDTRESLQQFFVAARTNLQGCYLATTKENAERLKNRCVQQKPQIDRRDTHSHRLTGGIHTARLIGGIYEVRR